MILPVAAISFLSLLRGALAVPSNVERSTPTTVAEWKAYEDDSTLQRLDPSFTSQTKVSNSQYMVRDRVLDLESTLQAANDSATRYLTMYSDVLMVEHDADIHVPPLAQIVTRVLAAEGNITLTVSRTEGDQVRSRGVLYLIAPTVQGRLFLDLLDTPWAGNPVEIDIGKPEENDLVGISISFFGPLSAPQFVWLTADNIDKLIMESDDLTSSLSAQLLAATSLFWTWPRMSLDIAAHVGMMASRSMSGKLLYLQAQSLADWLSGKLAAGPKTNPAPNLDVETYENAVGDALDVAQAFENRYNDLTDASKAQEERLEAWGAMVAQATDRLNVQRTLAQVAESDYGAAEATLGGILANFQAQTVFLAAAGANFSDGVDKYIEEQERQRIFDLATSLITVGLSCISFAASSGFSAVVGSWNFVFTNSVSAAEVAMGLSASGQAHFQEWIDTVVEAADPPSLDPTIAQLEATALGTADEAATAATIDAFRLVAAAGSALRDASTTTQQLVLDSRDIPGMMPTHSPYQRTEGEVHVLWDDYMSDNAWWIEQCIDLGIQGTRDVRAEMEKLTARGKLVAGAQSHLVRTGQDLVRARLAVHTAERDVERLTELKSDFEDNHELTEEARMAFYQRRMSVRTDIVRLMENATQAYRYQTLRESDVTLDPTVSLEDLQSRQLAAKMELLNWKSGFSSPPQKFTLPMFASEMGLQEQEILHSLKSPDTNHTFRFHLEPDSVTGGTPGPFVDGSYFHITELEVYLLGLEPVSTQPQHSVKLSVLTTGSYSNIRDDDTVFDFFMRPHSRSFQYTINEAGGVGINICANFGGSEWTTPTPFSEWAVYVWNPENYDFTNVTDVMILWHGEAYFDAMPSRRTRYPKGADTFLKANKGERCKL
ncbi:uncharacterized protein J7T54_007204 [Emericellopsis cladophorae]|uniref:Tc toxin complex TcA C-terminal TcB-binding domain-containing protein n=1 Tax=Emericellopsis cladophorae TaxID=2686198 RepID=A0A9P9XV38_9HYPO|nr:uncharacterized protein J7T54_007204 [Emericellopsis cladophorae]KAI6778158.1 hypothetical protein J7T54_007204 [Emericellopsis cladophorae]